MAKKKQNIAGKPVDFILFVTILILLAFGIIIMLSASSPSSLSTHGSSYYLVKKQITFAVVGIVAMIIISFIDYKQYKKYYKLAYIVSILLLLFVFLIGEKVNGATRWIDLGFTKFQPSEIVKVLLIIFYAAMLTDNKETLKQFGNGFVRPLLYLIPVIALLLLQPHLSASILIICIIATMMIIAGVKKRYFFMVGGIVGIPALLYLVFQKAYMLKRITSFLNPWEDVTGDSYQIIQSLYAIASGGIFGVGLGESKQKYSYLPEPQNDFIFSILVEEVGFIGSILVLVLFGIFIWRGIKIAINAPDTFGSLVAIGITSLVGIQAIFNILVVTSSIPATGISLPFFSYGGTSLMMLLASLGILLNISRQGKKEMVVKE